MRSPSFTASVSRLRMSTPQPSPMTKPLASASKGREPSGDKAPILENLT